MTGIKSDSGALRVISRTINSLTPNPANPRQHNRRQIRQIAKSIEAFGFNVPILVDSKLNIIAGHGRVLAAKHLAMSTVPTVSLDHLSASQIAAFTIADNRLTEVSSWDDKLLAEQLKELSLENLDFSIEATGFEIGEIDVRIESLIEKRPNEALDAEPPLVSGPAVSKFGDLWLLGNHRLYCGSALDPNAFRILMDGERAAMVFTDPPYNVPIHGHVSGLR